LAARLASFYNTDSGRAVCRPRETSRNYCSVVVGGKPKDCSPCPQQCGEEVDNSRQSANYLFSHLEVSPVTRKCPHRFGAGR
jgi:hypothetical protein